MATERSKLVPKGPKLASKEPMLAFKEPKLTFLVGPKVCFFGEKAYHSEALASLSEILVCPSYRIQ